MGNIYERPVAEQYIIGDNRDREVHRFVSFADLVNFITKRGGKEIGISKEDSIDGARHATWSYGDIYYTNKDVSVSRIAEVMFDTNSPIYFHENGHVEGRVKITRGYQ